jgi:hypothetical protein
LLSVVVTVLDILAATVALVDRAEEQLFRV